MNKNYLISIVGATAIGKTALSIKLARHFNTEIISSDSRQFYKEMNIGTAVPGKEELNQIKHHFIHNRSIFDDYSVGDFERDALTELDKLYEKHNIVVMVGGSGLYVNAVLNGLDIFPNIDPEIRKVLKIELQEKGIEDLQNQLKDLDPESYQNIDIDNHQRLIRALEICIGSGKPFSSFLKKKKNKRNFIPIKIGITAPREFIYSRINQRVDQMIADGLVEEAKSLYSNKNLNALQTVGYKELFKYFDEDFTLNFSVQEIKKNTRRFAKRQNTWFKKDKEIKWFDSNENKNEIINYINNCIE